MKKKFEIWKIYENELGRLVNVEDIVTAIDCSQSLVYRFKPGVTEQQVLANYAVDGDSISMTDWLEYLSGYDYSIVANCPESLDVEDESLCYEVGYGFFQPCSCGADNYRLTEWWDGNNWVKVYAPDEGADGITEIEFDPEEETMILDNDVEREFAFSVESGILIVCRSRYQGSYTTAEVISPAEFAQRCADYDIVNPFAQ